MTIEFTANGQTHTPRGMTGYRQARLTGTVVHQLLASDDVAVTRRAPKPRTGTYRAQFVSVALAKAFSDFLLDPANASIAMTDTDLPFSNMTFVPTDAVEPEVDGTDLSKWWVSFRYQEIIA